MIASDLARVLHAFRRMIEDRHLMRPRSSSSLAFLVIAASIGFCGGDAETVDAVIKASFGRRLAVLGPLENADLVGTDLALAVHNVVLPAIDSRPSASPYLQKLVADGKLGFKSGEGFRKWNKEQQAALRASLVAHLKAARDREKTK